MNKPIFQKLKKSNLPSITESPSSQQNIQYMSVQDIEKTLLSHINSQYDSVNTKPQNISYSTPSKNSIIESRRIPEIVQENDHLRLEIQKLKNEKNLILSQYENLSTFTKSYAELQADKKQVQREFSFRKSVQNAHKLITSQTQQKEHQKPVRQRGIRQQRHIGQINQKTIPSSDDNRNSRQQTSRRSAASLESSKGLLGNMRRSTSKQAFSTLEQRFYQYCKDQMVRMNTENTKLTLKIGQLQNKITSLHRQYELLEHENAQLKSMNESLQERLKAENQKISQINSTMTVTLAKKQSIIDSQFKHLQSQLNQLRAQSQTFRKLANQKDAEITLLKSQVTKQSSQTKNYTQLVAKNASLQNQVNELMVRNKKLGDKFRRMPVIDHLWEIKEVEYENLVNFIQQEKGELSSLEKSRANQISKQFNSQMHDLTFSKDKKIF